MSQVLSLAGFQVTLIGRFWVTPEEGKPCKITAFGALLNVADAYDYALQLLKAFKLGGCDAPDIVAGMEGTLEGIIVRYHDNIPHADGQTIDLPPDSPQGIVAYALVSAHLGAVKVGGSSAIKKNEVFVEVGKATK